MGSKARIAKHILPIMLKHREPGQYFVDLFAGGMNLIDKVDGNRIANDYNFYLIEMWKKVLSGWVPEYVSKELYNDVRINKDSYPPYFVGWVGFVCSFRGKFFGGYAGIYEKKNGIEDYQKEQAENILRQKDYLRDYQKEKTENILSQSNKLNGLLLSNKSYNEVDIPNNSIVYMDPPYQDTTGYVFSFDHSAFWNYARKISMIHDVYISEYQAPEDFKSIWEGRLTNSLSTKNTYKPTEKLFVYDKYGLL